MRSNFDKLTMYQRGALCWRQGGVRADCAKREGTPEHQEWINGYNAAAKGEKVELPKEEEIDG